MRTLYVFATLPLFALTLGLGTGARADWPYPFNSEPSAQERLWCAKDYVQSLESELKVMETLYAAGPEAVGRLCELIDAGNTWLGDKLSKEVRDELRSLLGVEVDLERVKTQCRAGQDSLERTLATRIGHLKAERLRCAGDTV